MIKLNLSNKEVRRTDSFEAFDNAKLSAQGKKLLKEWKKIEDLCHNNEVIDYIIRNRNREGLPVEYEIIFRLKSIVGVEEVEEGVDKPYRKPIYSNEHRLSILLPNNYPSAMGGNPEFKMLTDTWHPNIRATGKFKGRICQNDKDLGIGVGLDERIIRVGKYLQFQMYWAHDTYPWPEDKTVAEWIREEAEPMGWVNAKEGIYTDNSRLRKKQENKQLNVDTNIKLQDESSEDGQIPKEKPKLIKLEKLGSEKPESTESKDSSGSKKIIEIGKIKPDLKEKEKLEKERIEAERLEKERLEAERLEKEKIEAERLEKERLEAERIEQERIEAERLEKERLEAERIRARKNRSGKVRKGKIGSRTFRTRKNRSGKVRKGKTGSRTFRARKNRSGKVRKGKTGSRTFRTRKNRSGKVRKGKIGSRTIRKRKNRSGKIRKGKIGSQR